MKTLLNNVYVAVLEVIQLRFVITIVLLSSSQLIYKPAIQFTKLFDSIFIMIFINVKVNREKLLVLELL